MASLSRLRASCVGAGLGALLLLTGAHGATQADSWRTRVSTALQTVHDSQPAGAVGVSAAAVRAGAHADAQGRIEADVHHDCGSAAPRRALEGAGLAVRGAVKLAPLCVVEGWVSPDALPALAAVPGVTSITLPTYVRHLPHPVKRVSAAPGATTGIDATGRAIMHADQFVAQAGGGGGGVLVGVQSGGIDTISVIQSRGELPAVADYTSAAGGDGQGDDEGTALLEEVHAVAPDATLAFCDPGTFVVYVACLQQFVQAGAAAGLSVVALDDDLFYQQDPMSADGTDTAALQQFLTQNPGVALFTSAGNDNGSYWEGHYIPVSVASLGIPPITCNGQTDQYVHTFGSAGQVLTNLEPYTIGVPMTLAWADPPGTNSSNFDVYWVNPGSGGSGCLSTKSSTTPVMTNISAIVDAGANLLYIATPDSSLSGKFLKLWVGGDGLTTLSIATQGSVVSPQAFATGAISVGAVSGLDGIGNTIESFSSLGPITVVYPQPAMLQAPTFVAPDAVIVDAAGTLFENVLWPDGTFRGTSAAVPNAAAVAALLRGAFPQLTVPQVVQALKDGATPLGLIVPDDTFGFGRVDAMGALATFPAPTITALTDVAIDASVSTTSSSVPFTVTGFGALHFTVTSSNTALVPSQVRSPGVSVSSGCGSTTLSCTLTVTAAPYQGGTAALTVNAVDGAGRPAPATLHVTVSNPQTAPPPPPPPPPSASGGGGGGGGSLSLWELLALAGMALMRAGARVLRPRAAA